jgi:hypothetical protein
MIDVPITDAMSRLPVWLERARSERLFLTQDGQRVAALVSIIELDQFEALQDADDLRHALSITGDTTPTDGIPLDQAMAELEATRRIHP